ncbi:DHA2 family efflux MFS transporter permease subunit [Luteibacter aegosomaticola]|uniref:DHA2 family efflux MFS transporter permease subunit n=1 Tax=Luteibacter aegosomaticola TaxID=2911538 RepID=UPI001FF90814|nr:DHA2 family efflux MFS transporter permease subunit [Luteibacter aegosomaticola]UPG90248.1 DHA2 family efflux MFS transporter permease subunit [Luteibacter aegosomaticola]
MTHAVATTHTPGEHRMLVLAGLLATFMQAVNISIPNAALLRLQGGLSMSDDQVGWVFTSYIAASAVVMPLTHWLAARLGRKTIYLASLGIFILGLVLDVLARTPLQFVGARIVQGAASGTLAPLSMSILLSELPALRHGRIGLTWAVTGTLGILSGPALGGLLSEAFGWHAIFYASMPLAAFLVLVVALFLREQRPAVQAPFDFFGWAALSISLTGVQMLLDRGQRLEWFASTEVCIESAAAALGMWVYLVHIFTRKQHFLDRALFGDRNFTLGAASYFVFGFVLLPTLALTSPMLEEILGYPGDTAGLLTIPRGVGLLGCLLATWRVPAWLDNRAVLFVGAAFVVVGTGRMVGYSPLMDPWAVGVAGFLQGAGLGVLMPAITRATFSTLPPTLRAHGTVLFNLARLYGSTLGVAVVQLYFFINTQGMHNALVEHLRPYGAFAHVSNGTHGAALAALNEGVTGQAAMVAVVGQFKLLFVAMLAATPLIFFFRRPRAA